MLTNQAFKHEVVETVETDGSRKIVVRTSVNSQLNAEQGILWNGHGSDPYALTRERFIAYLKRQTELALVSSLHGHLCDPAATL